MRLRHHRFIIVTGLCAFLIFSGVGCGSNKEDAKSSAEQLLFYISKGDFDKAVTLCDFNSQIYADLSEFTTDGMIALYANEFGDTPEIEEFFSSNQTFNNLFQTYKEHLFDEYTITGEQDKADDYKIIYATVSHIDENYSEYYMADINQYLVEYYIANREELDGILEEKGEAAMTVEILQSIATKYCQICKDQLLENAVYYDVNYEISCKMIDNTWKVVEMNRQE